MRLEARRLIYRKLLEEEAEAWWALRLEALEREPMAFGGSPDEHRASTIEAAKELVCGAGNFILGAFDEGALDQAALHQAAFDEAARGGAQLVGIARFMREPRAKERHKGHVRGVYLRASYRGRGVAQEMMAALIAAAREEEGLEHLLLSAAVHNKAARALYRGMGFTGYGIEPGAMKVDREYVDEEHMILRLY